MSDEMEYILTDAVNRALDECIEEGILADILLKNRSEVIDMILTDYNEKTYLKAVRKESFEDGFESGDRHRLKLIIRKKLQKGCTISQIAEMLEEEAELIEQLIDEMNQEPE